MFFLEKYFLPPPKVGLRPHNSLFYSAFTGNQFILTTEKTFRIENVQKHLFNFNFVNNIPFMVQWKMKNPFDSRGEIEKLYVMKAKSALNVIIFLSV